MKLNPVGTMTTITYGFNRRFEAQVPHYAVGNKRKIREWYLDRIRNFEPGYNERISWAK